jgi:16S rRNA (guanine1516-N2)-methyltransferase
MLPFYGVNCGFIVQLSDDNPSVIKAADGERHYDSDSVALLAIQPVRSKMMRDIVVLCNDPDVYDQALSLSLQLDLPLMTDIEKPHSNCSSMKTGDCDYFLNVDGDGLSLCPIEKRRHGAIRIDFASGANAHRRHFGGGNGQTIAKAVGISGSFKPSVFDLTAGLGSDAFVLASLGCAVTLFERQPVIAALLRDAIARASADEDSELRHIMRRFSLRACDAIDALEASVEQNKPDVIFIDPMFPERKKSAQVKKEMQAFQNIVGSDDDSVKLLQGAIKSARHRVVVKRPSSAAFLGNLSPTYSLKGKSTRFDIFALSKLPS